MPAIDKLASVSASTKRNPAPVGGKIGSPTTNLTGLSVLSPMPVTPEIKEIYEIKSPRETFVTYIEGSPDIVEGDILVISSTEYHIKAVGGWKASPAFLELIIELPKGS